MKGMVQKIMKKMKKSRTQLAEEKVEAAKKAAARERIVEQIEEMGIDLKENQILLADGFEDAFIGIVERFSHVAVACYDKAKCLEILEKQGLNPLDAVEYFEYNVIGAWVGDYTPYFLTRGCPAQHGAREVLRKVAKLAAADAVAAPAADAAAQPAAPTDEK